MRLLEIRHDGTISLTEDLMDTSDIPAYAILSHTWLSDNQEVTFDEFTRGAGRDKAGFDKIQFCAHQAQQDGLRYFWVDTCCINKADIVELQHAINSMFRWYQDSTKCYALLTDVSNTSTWEGEFRRSRWFTRGWTLQELLAPRSVSFYSENRTYLGDRKSLKQLIHEVTDIPCPALAGAPLNSFSVETRLSWSDNRRTTREEDKAYSLLGIFGVFTFLNYGEGAFNAFRRLRKAIAEDSQESFQPQVSVESVGSDFATDTHVAHKPSYYIPFPKNRYFVGRTEELEVINQMLLEGKDCQKISIVGLGGTGKTQLALRFAYSVKETMSAVSVFWMPALSIESFEQACVAVATALHISKTEVEGGDVKELVKEHLSADRSGPWLLVLDNVDDHDILFGTDNATGIIDYLPESEKGMTVFTTRVQELAVSLTRGDILELGSMSKPDATSFLEKSLVNKRFTEDRKELEELLDELTCLPLAIAQAAAYLNMNKTTITKYLRLLRNTEQDTIRLISKEFRDQTRYKGSANAIASTWVVSFSQLQEHDEVAATLLKFMSCIEWKAIPRSLLPDVESEERMEEALGTLCGYSFVSRREGDKTSDAEKEEFYDLHRLVHLAIRVWIDKHDNTADVTQQALAHVANIFPDDDFEDRAIRRTYMPHALQLLHTDIQVDIHDRAELCNCVGGCLNFDGRYSEAVRWLEESCRCREGLEENDPDRLFSEHLLGTSYLRNGQTKEAIKLLEHVVKIKEDVVPETHRSLLNTQYELSIGYHHDGQIEASIKLMEHVVKMGVDTLAETDPSLLVPQCQLGMFYRKIGRIEDSIKLLEHVVEIQKSTVAENHSYRLASQYSLGVSYRLNGQIEESIKLLEHVVKVGNDTLPEAHPNRLVSQQRLGISYYENGQIEDSIRLLEHVVKVEGDAIAGDLLARSVSQHWLSLCYWENGQTGEAKRLMEHVVKIRSDALAEDHPNRLRSEDWSRYMTSELA